MTDSLVDLIESKLRDSVASGEFPVGCAIPSRRTLAEHFGVSERTVRAAIVRLVADGILSVRRRIGAVVLMRVKPRRKKLLLDVRSEDFGSCSGSMFSLGVRRTVEKAGVRYRDVQLTYRSGVGVDLSSLRELLDEAPDFVLMRAPNVRLPKVAAYVAARGIRYATVSNAVVTKGLCVGNVRYDASAPVEEFSRDCVRMSVRSVLQYDFGEDSYIDAQGALESCGISFERLSLTRGSQYEDLDALVRDAAILMKKRLKEGSLPELLFVTDDFLASGAIATLYREGLRIPQDIKVVAYANRGAGFSFLHTMACFEMDPYQEGVNCARSALRCLSTGTFTHYTMSPAYCRGESFPVH